MAGLPTIRSVAAGSPWARATAKAATVASSALLGDTRPTASQRPPEERVAIPAPGTPGPLGVGPDPAAAPASSAAEGAITDVAANPAWRRWRLVVGRVRHGQRGPRRQQPQVTLGTQLAEREMVVPGRHQLGRCDVVVVHHEGLGPAGQPRGHGRRRGELVHDHVVLLGRVGVAEGPAPSRRPSAHRRCRRRSRIGSPADAWRRASAACGVRRHRRGARRERSGGSRSRGRHRGNGEAAVGAHPVRQRRHLDESTALEEQLPGRLVQRTTVHQVPRGQRPGCRPPRTGSETTTRGAPRASVRRHSKSTPQQGVQCQAVHHATEHHATQTTRRARRPDARTLQRSSPCSPAPARAARPHPGVRPPVRPRPAQTGRAAACPRRSRRARSPHPACTPGGAPPPVPPTDRAHGPARARPRPRREVLRGQPLFEHGDTS